MTSLGLYAMYVTNSTDVNVAVLNMSDHRQADLILLIERMQKRNILLHRASRRRSQVKNVLRIFQRVLFSLLLHHAVC